MADRGIMVQDLFANKNDFINTHTMLKGKSQLKPKKMNLRQKITENYRMIEVAKG